MVETPGHVRIGRHNPLLRRLRGIVAREEPSLSVLDGAKLIADAAAAGARITELYGIEPRLAALAGSEPYSALARAGKVYAIDEAVVARLAPTRSPQGVLAVVEVPRRTVPAAGTVVFLADLQDPGNVGGIVRTAAALGASGVACSPACADPFSPRALRASAGTALRLPVQPDADLAALAAAVRAAGGSVAATAARAATPLASWRPPRPLLVVFGNEGSGLRAEYTTLCDSTVSIPMSGAAESLNVTVAAGIVLFVLAGVVTPPILERGNGEDE